MKEKRVWCFLGRPNFSGSSCGGKFVVDPQLENENGKINLERKNEI